MIYRFLSCDGLGDFPIPDFSSTHQCKSHCRTHKDVNHIKNIMNRKDAQPP